MIVSHATEIGSRDGNEDAYLVMPEFGLFAVCDGMGGHKSGEVASALAVRAMDETFQAMVDQPLRDVMCTAIARANKDILLKGRSKAHRGMGTTVVALAFGTLDTVALGWAGDSRCYRLRGSRLEQLTDDHSIINRLLSAGQITPQEVATHPDRGVIYRCLGLTTSESGDVRLIDVDPGDVYLLCSDGLTDAMSDEVIGIVLSRGGDAQALVDTAIAMGLEGQDNVTAVVVRP